MKATTWFPFYVSNEVSNHSPSSPKMSDFRKKIADDLLRSTFLGPSEYYLGLNLLARKRKYHVVYVGAVKPMID